MTVKGSGIGAPGKAGKDGAPGKDGNNGIAGKDGNSGTNGTNGIRGSTWATGNGAPATVALVGDMYLDGATGDVWQFS